MDTFEKLKMADLRWRVVPDPSLTINDAIMTSLLVLKVTNVSTNFLILSDTFCQTHYDLSIFRFEGKADAIWILPIESTI